MKSNLWYIIVGASLMACSAHFTPTFQISHQAVFETVPDTSLLKQLQPYRDTLVQEFSAYVATSPVNLVISRPGSNLMNWCADAVLSSQTANKRFSEPVICLLNTGGLRSSFGAGKLTLADFYKLMPFDNRVVWIHMPVSKITDIENYLKQSGGEPIANCSFKNGKLDITNLLPSHQYIWVLTTDFLANGGDKMNFFLGLEKEETAILLRDILIATAYQQDTLLLDPQVRYIR
jgi:2',3'-cyclic-nucleotide 2'-phosphodiesterase (5'-nucleotidase family)